MQGSEYEQLRREILAEYMADVLRGRELRLRRQAAERAEPAAAEQGGQVEESAAVAGR